jgi:hypothetical protein
VSASVPPSQDRTSVLNSPSEGIISFEEFVLLMQKKRYSQNSADVHDFAKLSDNLAERITSFKHLAAPKEVEEKFTTSELLRFRKLFAHFDMDCGASFAHL